MGALAAITESASRVRGSVSHLCEVLTRSDSDSADRFEAGDFSVDMAARTAKVRGRELRLSCAEFEVLVFLISHRRHLVTSRTRLRTRQQNSGLHDTEFLRALLSLQKKLRAEVPGAQYLHTEAWFLYEFHPGL